MGYATGQTDRQTDIHTDTLLAILRTRTRGRSYINGTAPRVPYADI